MEVRVLFEGTLDKCTFEHGKKDWKRRHFVFKHILSSNIRSLEFYAAGAKNWRKSEPKGVLALYPGYEIVKVHEPKRHFVFEIKTVDHTYRLAAHSEDELNQWILVLERESIVNSFCVEPEANDQMAKLGAADICHLHIANSELRLLCAKDGRLLVAWPFTCLRRYMSTRGKFTVEAGRRAPTGEGKFTFLTPQHDEIYKLLDNVVRSRAGNKASSTASHAPLRKTKSVPNSYDDTTTNQDIPQNGYDHLMATSPATNNQMSPGSSNSMKNAYAAPYGHLPSRDAMKTGPPVMGKGMPQAIPGSTSVKHEEGGQYNALNHTVQGFDKHVYQDQKGAGDDEYCTLDQPLSPPTEGQDVYSVLYHQGSSQPPPAPQHPVTEDVYNVLGETLPHVVTGGIQPIEEDMYNTLDKKSTSHSQLPASAPQVEETYNTLDHATPARPPHKPIQPPSKTESRGKPVVKPPLKPRVRKPSGDPVNKLQTSHSSSGQEGDDMYNTLDTNTRPPPPPVRKIPEQSTTLQKSSSVTQGEVEDDMYNTLEPSKARRPPLPVRKAPERLKKLQKSQSVTVDDNNDTYNTLDTTKVGHSPVLVKKIQTSQMSIDQGDEMYKTLDAAARVSASPSSAPRLSESVDEDEMYNTLDSTRVGATASPVHSERVDNELPSNLYRNDDVYNTLDKSKLGSSSSVPVPPHCNNASSPVRNPVKKDSPKLKRNSSSSLQSVRCPLDIPASKPEVLQRSLSQDDLDSYASIDYATMTPPKVAQKQSPVPAQRNLNSKGLPSKLRKSSAPDIISLATTNGGKDVKKGGKSALVLNLKASLEAGGLDFSKPRRKPKKISREDSGELPTHAEVEERGVTPTSEDVFTPGTPPIKTGRSSSSPADPSQGEDIYDELDQSAPRPKSLQIIKAKKSPKK